MKTGIVLVVLLVSVLVGPRAAYPETICTKDGQQIKAKITEKTENTIWYEVTTGDIIEETGIDIADVDKILNDDGSVSEYSPAVYVESAKW